MDTKLNVILPLPNYLLHTKKKKRNKGVDHNYENKMIPVETALNILMKYSMEDRFSDMVLHNISLRNIMRTLGATALIKELCSIVTPNQDLESKMSDFV